MTTTTKVKSYLALGDSYTIGEGVSTSSSWPVQLTNALNKKGYEVATPKIIAQTGWRTDNLIEAIDNESITRKYDLVSVLIGVNNQFQGKSIDVYKKDLRALLNTAIVLCEKGRSGVFVLSIPDYGATPFGKVERETIAGEIDEWNRACKTICDEFEVPFYDITSISRKAVDNAELTAKDGLHPSAKMYALWVEAILESVVEIIE